VLRPFTAGDLDIVTPWFDDPETKRWLGGREWPENLLRLIADPPTAHRGNSVRERAGWIAVLAGEPVALADTEIYDDASAAIAFVVAPQHRRHGVATGTLQALATALAASHGVERLVGGVEQHNDASLRCVRAAGFVPVADTPDDEGFIDFVLVTSSLSL
jgi:RimJ/RimL family protein N-acetyltransferase